MISFNVFGRLCKFSDVFAPVRIRSYAIGCIWVPLDAFGLFFANFLKLAPENPPRPPGLRACRLSGLCPPYPPLLLLFPRVLHASQKIAGFAASGRLWYDGLKSKV